MRVEIVLASELDDLATNGALPPARATEKNALAADERLELLLKRESGLKHPVAFQLARPQRERLVTQPLLVPVDRRTRVAVQIWEE